MMASTAGAATPKISPDSKPECRLDQENCFYSDPKPPDYIFTSKDIAVGEVEYKFESNLSDHALVAGSFDF